MLLHRKYEWIPRFRHTAALAARILPEDAVPDHGGNRALSTPIPEEKSEFLVHQVVAVLVVALDDSLPVFAVMAAF